MVDTPYAVWILTLLLYLSLIVIFLLTTYFVKRSCLKQLSYDRQRPVVAQNHVQSTMKRAVLIIQVGYLEVCAGLIVVMEATADVMKLQIGRDQPGKEEPCSEHYQCAGQLHYISFAIVGCLFLSIVRCLAQRYVVERLSKSDVVSMTRIYLVPATCLVTVLCVWSWFRRYDDREKKQSDRNVCCNAIQAFPLNSFLLVLLPIFWNLVMDYSENREEKMGLRSTRVGSQTTTKDGLKYDSASLKQTKLVSEVALSQDHPIHTLSITTGSSSRNDTEIANTKPPLSTNITLPVGNAKISYGPQCVQFTDKTAVGLPSVFESLRDFLNIYTRIYLSLVIYLAALIGVYAFLATCHAFSGMDDITTAVFMTMVVITGILRAIQVSVAEALERDGLKCEKLINV